jgi:hypothetical protein
LPLKAFIPCRVDEERVYKSKSRFQQSPKTAQPDTTPPRDLRACHARGTALTPALPEQSFRLPDRRNSTAQCSIRPHAAPGVAATHLNVALGARCLCRRRRGTHIVFSDWRPDARFEAISVVLSQLARSLAPKTHQQLSSLPPRIGLHPTKDRLRLRLLAMSRVSV